MEGEQDRIHTIIEGIEFTLFYDYDELRDHKLYKISDEGRIEWFQQRMKVVFLEPLSRIFDQDSLAHKALCSHEKEYEPVRTVMIIAFSSLLNGVESLGSFLVPVSTRNNKTRFVAFMQRMPHPWTSIGEELWKDFRNGIAHQFVVPNGGIEFRGSSESYWYEYCGEYKILKIEPVTFFRDFKHTVKKMFQDVYQDDELQRLFMERFKRAYPQRSDKKMKELVKMLNEGQKREFIELLTEKKRLEKEDNDLFFKDEQEWEKGAIERCLRLDRIEQRLEELSPSSTDPLS